MNELTRCEREVLAGIVAGKPNKTIAYERGCALGTVKTQARALLVKSGERSRTALVAWAVRNGVIDREDAA